MLEWLSSDGFRTRHLALYSSETVEIMSCEDIASLDERAERFTTHIAEEVAQRDDFLVRGVHVVVLGLSPCPVYEGAKCQRD